MQASFWKTIAVVGVIGVGSMALLEVQRQLSEGKTAANDESQEDVDPRAVTTGDQSVDAVLTDSEFERLLKGEPQTGSSESANDFQFEMKEPPVASAAVASPDLNGFSDSDFNANPVAPQEVTPPPVNTDVQLAALSKGSNPFDETSAAVSANYQTAEPQTVEQVGFEEKNSPPAFSDAEGFPAFGEETEPAPKPVAASNLAPTPAAAATTPAQTAGNYEFFGAGGETSGTAETAGTATAATLQATPDSGSSEPTEKVTAQFYGDQQTESTPASTFENSTPMFDADGPAPPLTTEPTQLQPSAPPEFDALPFPGTSSSTFEEDKVPEPREPLAPTFNPIQPVTKDELRPEPENFDQAPDFKSRTLPIASDNTGTDTNRVPDLGSPGTLSIPGLNESSPQSMQPGDGIDPGASFAPDSTKSGTRSFGSSPSTGAPFQESDNMRDAPVMQYNEPGIPLNGDRREFDTNERFNDRIPNRIDSQQNRTFDSGTFDRQLPSIQPGNERGLPETRRDELRPEFNQFDNRPADNLSNMDIGGRDSRPDQSVRQISSKMSPNLVLEKTAPENATVGSPLDYYIYVKNEGDATAYDVVVDDDVTSAASVDGAHPQSDYDKAAGKLIWRFKEIQPGKTEKITVRVTPTGEGVLDGVASVKFKSRVQATTVITAPKLRLQMQGPDEVRLGEEVAYRYIITNEGSGEARDVYLRTLLPASGGLKHAHGRDLEYEIKAMKPGQQREIMLAVIAGEPGDHKAEAEVSAAGGTADSAAWRTKVVGAQLQIVRRGPKRRFVNRSATYENIISNDSNFDALDAKVVEKIPDGMRFMGATMGGQYNEATHSVTWMINRLGPGRQEQLQLELMPTRAGNMESVVTILENVGVQSDDYVSTTVVEDLHNVSATISQLDGPVATGEAFGFTINIDNRGTAEATDVELLVEVPEEIQVIGAGSRETPAKLIEKNNTVQYSMILKIAPGAKKSFELKLKGQRPINNGHVKALVQYKQMNDPLVVSESVTIYDERL